MSGWTCDLWQYIRRKGLTCQMSPFLKKNHSNVTWLKRKIHFSFLYVQRLHNIYLKKNNNLTFFKNSHKKKPKIFLMLYWSCEASELCYLSNPNPHWFLSSDDGTLQLHFKSWREYVQGQKRQNRDHRWNTSFMVIMWSTGPLCPTETQSV